MFSRNLWIVCLMAAIFIVTVDALPMQRFVSFCTILYLFKKHIAYRTGQDAYKSNRLARRMVPRSSVTESPLRRFIRRFHHCKDTAKVTKESAMDMELQALAKDIKAAVVRVEPYIENLAEQESAYSAGIPPPPTTGAWATASPVADDNGLFVRLERREMPKHNAKRQAFETVDTSSQAPALVQYVSVFYIDIFELCLTYIL